MISLYNGDCRDILVDLINDGIKVDMVLTDPPYGTTHLSWDSVIPFDDIWPLIYDISNDNTPILLFGIEPFSSYLRLSNVKDYKYDFYWKKERITNISQVKRRAGKIIETISVFYRKQPYYNPQMVKYNGPKRTNKVKDGCLGDITNKGGCNKVKEYVDTGYRYPTQLLEFKRDILKCNLHPTQKPVDLLKYLIKTFTKENDIVLDFTMGSGSTGVACIETNRSFIGIEKDPKIYKIAEDRIKDSEIINDFFD
jgi:site-specific DNA-methyltransferase (adenine-specific)